MAIYLLLPMGEIVLHFSSLFLFALSTFIDVLIEICLLIIISITFELVLFAIFLGAFIASVQINVGKVTSTGQLHNKIF